MPASADKIVLTSAVVTLGSTVAVSMLPESYGGKGELPSPRLLVGTSLTFMALSVLADFAPGISGPLSAAIAVTAVTYYGIPILDNWLTGAQNPVGFPGEQSKPKATTQKRNG